jgi:hypothetical protein
MKFHYFCSKERKNANTPETPYKTTVNMDSVSDLKKALDTAGRYVWLDLTASPLTAIEEGAFYNCKMVLR